MKQNLLYVKDLLDTNGDFKSLESLNETYNIRLTFLHYLQIRQSLPGLWRKQLHTCVDDTHLVYNEARLAKTKSKVFYWILLNTFYNLTSKPVSHERWEQELENSSLDFDIIHQIPFKVTRVTALQTMQYKVIHRIITCNYWLNKLKIVDSEKCNFCNSIDTVIHHLITCDSMLAYWSSFLRWWNSLGYPELALISETDILFGYPRWDKEGKILNICILLSKKIILRSKLLKKKPFFYEFQKELRHYIEIERAISIANKTCMQLKTEWRIVDEAL